MGYLEKNRALLTCFFKYFKSTINGPVATSKKCSFAEVNIKFEINDIQMIEETSTCIAFVVYLTDIKIYDLRKRSYIGAVGDTKFSKVNPENIKVNIEPDYQNRNKSEEYLVLRRINYEAKNYRMYLIEDDLTVKTASQNDINLMSIASLRGKESGKWIRLRQAIVVDFDGVEKSQKG